MKVHENPTWIHEFISLFIFLPFGVLIAAFSVGGKYANEFLLYNMYLPLMIAFVFHLIIRSGLNIKYVSGSTILYLKGLFVMIAFGAILVGFVNFF